MTKCNRGCQLTVC